MKILHQLIGGLSQYSLGGFKQWNPFRVVLLAVQKDTATLSADVWPIHRFHDVTGVRGKAPSQ